MESIGKLLETILTHYEKRDYPAAEKAADELIAAYPGFPRGQFLKAVILEETGRAGEAEPHYAKAGNRSTLWLRLALQLQDADPQRALMYYERVSATDPQNNLVWLNMGAIHEKQGRPAEARACYRHLAPVREVFAKVLAPLGFLLITAGGAIMMLKRGDKILASLLIASAAICLLWLKRDGKKAVQMLMKKGAYT